MRMLTRLILGAGLAAGTLRGAAALQSQAADDAAIRRVITDGYFAGGHLADSLALRNAFHLRAAHMLYAQADTLVDVPITDYITRVGTGGPRPAGTPDRSQRRILMVDVSGTAAVAKLEIRGPNATFVDYMSLLKVNGRWQIVNKIFHRS